MSTPKLGAAFAILGITACATHTEMPMHGPRLGVPTTNAELASWDISIPPSGAGLPVGSGTARGSKKPALLLRISQ